MKDQISLTLRERIIAAINDLQDVRASILYPEQVDADGNTDFVCHFCEEVGMFHAGDGGISHTPECAVSLIHRIPKDGKLHFFDDLAYISILYQIASLERYPRKPQAGHVDWQYFCPFCQCVLHVKVLKREDGRSTTTYTMPHNQNCIVTLAKAELEQQGGQA